MISYADLMRLLFGFFILMYVFTLAKLNKAPQNIDNDTMIHMRRDIAKYFGGEYVTPLEEATKNFKSSIASKNIGDNISIKLSPEGLDVTFQSNILFKSGSAELLPKTRESIKTLAGIIQMEKNEYRVLAEGHTDDMPIKNIRHKFPSNWELSASRASAVIRVFEAEGFKPKNLVAIGFGKSRPIFKNRDEKGHPIPDNMARNRRIRIKVSLTDGALNPNSDEISVPLPEAENPSPE